MKLHFSLEYRTNWGESVAAELELKTAKGHINRTIELHTEDGLLWKGEAFLSEPDICAFTYRYCILQNSQVIRREWNGVPRHFTANSQLEFFFPDYWKDIPLLSHLYSSAYTNTVSHCELQVPQLPYFQQTLIFRVQAPQLQAGQCLALIGSQPPLGDWNPQRALRMVRGGMHEWCISLSATALTFPFEYKYVVLDEQTGEFIRWEEGDNRVSPFRGVGQNQVLCVYDPRIRMADVHWKTAGVVIPVFSLRSEGSQGMGDFGDLKSLVDWACQTGMKVIQLLPIYDTTQTHHWTDSYPYNSISIYALHPLYIDLRQLPAIEDEEFMQLYQQTARQLNEQRVVDYELVDHLKHAYLHALYAQKGSQVMQESDYQQFYERNAEWLLPYAAFSYLRDQYGTADFSQWPDHQTFDRDEVARLCAREAQHPGELGYYMFVQYLLHTQLLATSTYARQHGVVLKGDIPIGISRYSVEAWVEPYYFHMNGQAGAPPDDFSVNGQNWGFPTYNWERMAQDGYQWWIRRFRKMAEYFDAYRIDHVLGFFRIWQIPMHSVHGLLGQFSPSLPMSVDEIENEWGLPFRREYFTKPLITDKILEDVFPGIDQQRLVKRTFLDKAGADWYTLKADFDTQRKVLNYICSLQGDERNRLEEVKEGVYSLISNVLFIADAQDPERFHPRISAMDDYVFGTLSGREREAFLRLYEHYYYERHNDFWYQQAMQKLPALVESTPMLVCAEDLGMVPACVAPVMEALRMLSLEIQAMPKQFGVRFGRLEQNPYRSVATIFTHDMTTLRQWWEEDTERTQAYWNEILQKDGQAPQVMPGWLCEEVIARHLYSPSMLCLISLQDWLSMDEQLRNPDADAERINIPANPRHYWRYRMHLTIEELTGAHAFNKKVSDMITRADR